jgi:hypothetical protein
MSAAGSQRSSSMPIGMPSWPPITSGISRLPSSACRSFHTA